MKLRRPERLHQPSLLVFVQNDLLAGSLREEFTHGIRLSGVQSDIVHIVVCPDKVPASLPAENHRVSITGGQGKMVCLLLKLSPDPAVSLLFEIHLVELPADAFFGNRAV